MPSSDLNYKISSEKEKNFSHQKREREQNLKEKDPLIFDCIQKEHSRQEEGIELISSENYVSHAVLEAQGSILTNKYAEGYPSKRYYGGCQFVDEIETLAIKRACKIFQAEAANVQPHSGSQANMAVYFSLLTPGDTIMGMDLIQGGHLTHGSPVNFSGKLFKAITYGVHPKTHLLDYDEIRDLVKKKKPKLLIAGASAYPRTIHFEIMGQIAKEAKIPFIADIAHIAGLIAAKLHPSPIPYATYTTSTTHKTLRGPRGGLILSKESEIKAVNSQIFPGIQGGPLIHVIAAKAVAFKEALLPSFINYQKNILENAKALSKTLMELGLPLVTQGTDTHQMLVNLGSWQNQTITGKDAEKWLDYAGITVNKNTVPDEKRGPFITSGIRIGVPAVTTRGMGPFEMKQIGTWIFEALCTHGEESELKKIHEKVKELCAGFPLKNHTRII